MLLLPSEDEILYPNAHLCPTLLELRKMYRPYIKSLEEYKFVSHYIKYFIGNRDLFLLYILLTPEQTMMNTYLGRL